MSNKNNNEPFVWIVLIISGMIIFAVYNFLKSVGAAIGLPPGPTAWMLLGCFSFVGGLLYAWLSNRRVLVWGAWLIAGGYLFFIPALTHWSMDFSTKLAWEAGFESRSPQFAWYGTTWAQVVIFLGLCGTAMFIMYKDDDWD